MKFEVAIYPPHGGVDNPYLRLISDALMRTGLCIGVNDFSFRFLVSRRGVKKIVHLQWAPAISRSRFAKGLKGDFYWMRENARVFVALASVWLAKIVSRATVVWTIHDAPVFDVHPTLMRLLRACHFWLADGYVIHAESARDDIPGRWRGKPCVFLPRPNGIRVYGPIADHRQSIRMRRYLGLPEHSTVFLVFGWIRMYKNIDRIIESFRSVSTRHRNAYVVVAGAHYDESAVRNLLHAHASVPNVIPLIRNIPDHYVASLLGAADYVVVGQERGYTSGVMFTAMSYKKPVIVRDWGAAPAHIRDGKNGFLFEWDNLPAIFGRAIAIKKSPLAYRRMCGAAYRTMLPLTWDRFAHSLISFYRTPHAVRRGVRADSGTAADVA